MKVLFLVPMFLLASQPALACVSLPPTPTEAARGTTFIGYVTGEDYPDYEATLLRTGTAQYPLLGRHVVRVTPTETLHGEVIGSVELETPCYSSKPSAGQKAIVVRYAGNDYVLPATEEYERAIRDAIASMRER